MLSIYCFRLIAYSPLFILLRHHLRFVFVLVLVFQCRSFKILDVYIIFYLQDVSYLCLTCHPYLEIMRYLVYLSSVNFFHYFVFVAWSILGTYFVAPPLAMFWLLFLIFVVIMHRSVIVVVSISILKYFLLWVISILESCVSIIASWSHRLVSIIAYVYAASGLTLY